MKLLFVHADGSFLTDNYFSSDSGASRLYQPIEISTGAEKVGYQSRRIDATRSLSLLNLSNTDKAALKLFYDVTVNGMEKAFTLRDFSYFSPFTFDSTTAFTFDSTIAPTFDNDHVFDDLDYRFNQTSLEFGEDNTLFSTFFELLEVN